MDSFYSKELINKQLQKFEAELIEIASRMLKNAGDPFSAVIRFLHERPENVSLPGYVVKKVLIETFGEQEKIPALINILANNVKEIIRHSNIIELINESPAMERWGNHLIKQKERINFEVGKEKGKLVLKNIAGLLAVEHGIELPLEKILVNPPKLEVTLKLGPLRPHRTVDM